MYIDDQYLAYQQPKPFLKNEYQSYDETFSLDTQSPIKSNVSITKNHHEPDEYNKMSNGSENIYQEENPYQQFLEQQTY